MTTTSQQRISQPTLSSNVSDVMLDGKYLIKEIRLGTVTYYEAYEPSVFGSTTSNGHSSITSQNESGRLTGWFGKIGTRRVTPEIDRLTGQERYAAYDVFRRAQHDLAYDLICRAFPAAARGQRRDGEIVIVTDGGR